jgi:cation transport regulator
MSYETIEDLPSDLRAILPREAQELYLDVYQRSWETYEEEQGGDMGQESVAHRDAWSAVRREYVKDEGSGRWYPKGDLPEDEEDEDEGLIDKIKDVFQ